MPEHAKISAPYMRPKLGLKNKPKPWSHQRELEALKDKEIEISFGLGWTRFMLLNADQFTLQVQDCNNKSVVTYNKSAMWGYRAV